MMCRSQSEGGRRCAPSESARLARNAVRRHTYHANADQQAMETMLAREGRDWKGSVLLDLTDPVVTHAYSVAVVAHQGVRRSSGDPYIDHPLRVAARLQEQGFKPQVVAIALLHDVVEDTAITLDDLRRKGFDEFIVTGVGGVTKDENLSKLENVARAAAVFGSQPVKLEDNLDNSAEEQLLVFSTEVAERKREQYGQARVILLPSLFADNIRSLMSSDDHHQQYIMKISGLLNRLKTDNAGGTGS